MRKYVALLPILAIVAVLAAGLGTAAPQGTVTVKETNFKIIMAGTARAGSTTFVVKNASNTPHDFAIKGPGVSKKTPKIKPGGTAKLTVTLKKGKYQVWCSVSGHSSLGMRRTITAV